MSYKVLLAVVLVVVVGGISYVVYNSSNTSVQPAVPQGSQQANTSAPTTPTAAPAVPVGSSTFTLADIAAHNSQTSCYTVVRGSVYDLTNWISQHPGGKKAILGMCGIDATEAFVKKHGGQQRPEAELATFKIGTLAN
ncbi:MAG TPA: cytochrome b5-like heme/steroid binding domain-containing protein [Candidatus Paceibacterota bacterium]|nr:cytochrome b5-like heme/steroid binding domain-containing protein [Candidatus Paceibacterota bacterium]HVN66851.1 cytochrome b5-like heme/steroid binding domain-containing protein [Candidatus Sulfotelmatobacter sp.]